MKKLGSLVICFLMSLAVMAEDGDSKKFLFLFNKKELKEHKISMKDIESQFAAFKTKTYGGNSELALILETPKGNFDECFVGQFLVRNRENINLKLEELAFRMVDMTETKQITNALLAAYEESLQAKKAERKAEKP